MRTAKTMDTTLNITDIATASELYNYAATCKVQHRAVNCDPFHSLCIAISRFYRELDSSDQRDEYWAQFVGHLLDYRYAVLSTPLPFNHPTLCDPSASECLNDKLKYCDSLYPHFAVPARKLLELYRQVAGLNDNPLGEAVLQIISEIPCGDKFALLVERARHARDYARSIEEYYNKAMRNLEVLTPAQLREPCFYEHIILTGIPERFPSYVFSAPRCANLYVVHYRWIKRSSKVGPSFVDLLPRKQASSGHAVDHDADGGDADNSLFKDEQELIEDDSDLEEDDAVWPGASYQVLRAADIFRNMQTIASRFDSSLNNESARHTGTLEHHTAQDVLNDSHDVRAKLFLLEDEYGVFLDADEDSQVMAVDIDSDIEPKVERIPTSEVEPEMFVLLRMAGGGDYISDLADEILGTDAQALRHKQRMWKQHLRARVDELGVHKVVAFLEQLGCSMANEQNVRNWISFRSIRTRHERDFEAIMKFVGLESQHSEIWNDMGKIASAHRKAGQRIRKLLLERVRSADLRNLRRSGKMEFRLEGGVGGRMAILRVEDISHHTVLLPPSRLGRPFLIKDMLRAGDLWAMQKQADPTPNNDPDAAL